MKIFIDPFFRGDDKGDGGIRQVVTAMERHLPAHGWEPTRTLFEADLVHSHGGNLLDVPAGVPWVASCHGLYWDGYDWPKWAHKLNGEVAEAMRRADHVTACSEWVAQIIRRGTLLSPTVLCHGVDPEMWDGGTDGGYVLWNKTRVDPICDPEPMDKLAALAPDVRFVSTFGKEALNVTLTGRLPFAEGAEYVRNAGVYLCTARETFGIGTLEAMAAGVPVLGWAWGGQREIVQHGVTGWLARPGDYDGLFEGLRWCLAHRAEAGAAAQADVLERWTWERVMVQYAALYDGLMAEFEARRQAPRVSVVVPCYNLAEYLPDALDSLMAQGGESWEAIVVDDASTDDTQAVALDYVQRDSKRIRYLRNTENLYLAGALNAGIAQARGRYVLPLDADNMLAHGALGLLADALDADRGIDIAYGAVKFVLEDGATPDESVGRGGRSGWPRDFNFKDQISHRNQIPSSSMYRRSVWERTGGYRRRYRTAEDAEFWTRATSFGAVPRRVTDALTLLYRQREGSMSRVNTEPDWTAWFPWSRRRALTPFGVACEATDGLSWPVPTFEPPKVAVIVPVGPGHEGLLIDALDSVQAQTYTKWECIVVNDTGFPLPWVPSWAKVLDSPAPQSGPATCRNLAIRASTAPLFVPLDADDYLQPGALEAFIAAHREHGGVVYSQWFDEHDNASSVYDPPAYDARLLVAKGCIHAVTACYAKADWQRVGGFDESISHWEDWDFQLALAARGVCGTKVAAPLWTYRKDRGKRREQNIATFEDGKRAILAKWDRYWKGEELMACRTCGGTTVKPAMGSPAAPASTEGLVKLEYLGPSAGTVTYRGISGASYRFANSEGQRVKYVKREDVGGLLALTGKFRLAVSEAPATPTLSMTPAPKPEPVLAGVTAAPVGSEPLKGGAHYWALRQRLPSMTEEDIALDLATERARPEPRADVVKLLEAALRKGDDDV